MGKQTIAIAGATGFVGKKLIDAILEHSEHDIVCLSRRMFEHDSPRVTSRICDFYSLRDAEAALKGCDQAVYLIHSMSISNRLSQGVFADFDYILADNFARAAADANLQNIIYIGGMCSEEESHRSTHLNSRIEVEQVLASTQIPTTVLRCSMIIGPNGSSFLILKKLVERLPVLGLPSWLRTRCQPIYIQDVIDIVINIIDNDKAWGKIYDCGSDEVHTYQDLIKKIIASLNVSRVVIELPYIPITISKLWVRLFSGADKSLIYPLIDSVNTPMLLSKDRLLPTDIAPNYTDISKALSSSIHQMSGERDTNLSAKPNRKVRQRNEVRSIQRLPLPEDMNAYHIAKMYTEWLPKSLSWILTVETQGNFIDFYFKFMRPCLLRLEFIPGRSQLDRQLFLIQGGILAIPNQKGRLEFRVPKTKKFVFAAIHDYQPSLPWWVYRCSQALFHKLIMSRFDKILLRKGSQSS